MSDAPTDNEKWLRDRAYNYETIEVAKRLNVIADELAELRKHREAMQQYVSELAETLGVDTQEVTLQQLIEHAQRNREWCATKLTEVAELSKENEQLRVDVKMHRENTDHQHDRALEYMRERDAALKRLEWHSVSEGLPDKGSDGEDGDMFATCLTEPTNPSGLARILQPRWSVRMEDSRLVAWLGPLPPLPAKEST